ncbi:MAG: membrane dipeptidase [bacterium]|jgi:membrane dipeptidase
MQSNLSENQPRYPHVPVFDGHNDVLSKLRNAGGVRKSEQFLVESAFHIDKIKAAKGRLAGGFFAMWVASPGGGDYQSLMLQDAYDVPLPSAVLQADALNVVIEQAAILLRLQQLDAVKICTSKADLESCLQQDALAAVMHLEGCEAIDPEFNSLDVLYAAGLRSLGPVWSRSNIFGEGVPFRFPSTPDIGAGLTSSGVELIRRCDNLGILVDLSHLNWKGFLDVAKHSNAPLVATHSNVHSLSSHSRNLTDEQLNIIKASSGMVGLNYATAFLRSDGKMLPDVPLDQMMRHLDHLLEFVGEDGVGLGSDFDGAEVPEKIGDSAGLPVLVRAMYEHGYGDELINKICFGNWINVLGRTWA